MQQESKRNAVLIDTFTNKFLDKRRLPYMEIKKAYALCRTVIENSLSRNPNMDKIILNHDWIKELIVNNVLLRIHFYGVLGEMDAAEKNSRKTGSFNGYGDA